jgi:O-antigen/teichoic acid export membrane protein
MPMAKDKAIFINSILGAAIGVALNILLVSLMGASGSAIVWLSSEAVILVIAQIWVYKFINLKFPLLELIKNCIVLLPCFFICIFINNYIELTSFFSLCLGSFIIFGYFLFVQIYFIKNQFVIGLFNTILKVKSRKSI